MDGKVLILILLAINFFSQNVNLEMKHLRLKYHGDSHLFTSVTSDFSSVGAKYENSDSKFRELKANFIS